MSKNSIKANPIGWIGAGRMGFPMAERLLMAGCDLSIWNRTRSKAEPLMAKGAQIANDLVDLASCDIVFTMVSTENDLTEILFGEVGVLSGESQPRIVVDCSSISAEVSGEIRERLGQKGIQFIASPVSGNGKCVKAGKLSVVSSGPKEVFDTVEPYLEFIGGQGVTYVGDGDLARIVKICHNVFLGVVTQSMSELIILAQKAGVPRHAFLNFMNKSVMGSVFSRYKTPAWVNLDYNVTFTPELMRKDMDLGLKLGRKYDVPMFAASSTREVMQASIGSGNRDDVDFSIVLDFIAKCSGLTLESENQNVSDQLDSQ